MSQTQRAHGVARFHRFVAATMIILVCTATLAACGSSDDVAGTYTHPTEGSITLSDDGSWSISQGGVDGAAGTYTLDGTTITFDINGEPAGTGTLEGDELTDPDGNVFVRE